MPIYIHGTAEECAAALGVTVQTFYNYITRFRAGPRTPKKIEIFRDEKEDDDLCDG